MVTSLIRRQVPGRRLREILLLGQTLSAAEAVEAGLVNRTCSKLRLKEETLVLAETIKQAAPGTTQRTKRLLNQLDDVEQHLQMALEVHLDARHGEEAKEGIAAFLEKRPPRWV